MLARSPRILSISWGTIEVEALGEMKDAKCWPGGAREWDWSETGTRHSPGIQPADVEELLDAGATTLVLSRGMEERLGVAEETLAMLRERGIEVHTAETGEAMDLYNELAATTPVGGLFHSTC
ncbi:Mth938-like domain-containing protein [Dactylosporangium sp. CA-139066]|uniref:Mth938-like domain-containing protein n=1 Tax=Dactylosporangium sp. CA-139066 TaxID=3239930 RepID=UPI003D8A3DF1